MAEAATERRTRDRREVDRQSKGKRIQRLLRENWYRDVWLLIITLVVLLTCFAIAKQFSDLKELRAKSIASSCRDDQSQDNVLRAILQFSLDNPNKASRLTPEEAANVAERLLQPLGGLHPTSKDLEARCRFKVRQFVTDPPG